MQARERTLRLEIIARVVQTAQERLAESIDETAGLNSDGLLEWICAEIANAAADEPSREEDVAALERRCEELDSLLSDRN